MGILVFGSATQVIVSFWRLLIIDKNRTHMGVQINYVAQVYDNKGTGHPVQ